MALNGDSPVEMVFGKAFGGMGQWRMDNIEAQVEFHNAMFRWLEGGSQASGTTLKRSLRE